MKTTLKPARLTRRDRQVIAEHLRAMAADTHTLLHFADASLCGDVAAILRARATRVEAEAATGTAARMSAPGLALYAQT